MALNTGIRQSRVICSVSKSLNSYSAPLSHNQAFNKEKFNYEHNKGQANESSFNWKEACKFTTVIGLAGFALKHGLSTNELLAEEDAIQELIDKENRQVIVIFLDTYNNPFNHTAV